MQLWQYYYDTRVLSGINSGFRHPLISEVISWQCFLTVLILESTCGFRATVFCLFDYCYGVPSWWFQRLPGASWHLLKLSDTSWCFIMLPIASCCLLILLKIYFWFSVHHCLIIKIIINKQTQYCDLGMLRSTVNSW